MRKSFNISITALSLGAILLFAILRILISGHIPLNWDTPILIEGAYRVFLGQKPHIDFSTPLGPIIYLAGAIGMKITTPTIAGLNIGYVIFDLFLLIISYFALKKFLNLRLMAVFLVLLSSMVFTPRMLSYATNNFGYTGIYNLYGYSIFFILLALLFSNISKEDENFNSSFSTGIWTSLLIALLLLLKVTFGCAALFITAVAFCHEKHKIKFLHGCGIGGISLLLALAVWMDFNLLPIFRDLRIVIESRIGHSPFTSVNFIELFFVSTANHHFFILFSLIVGSLTMPQHKKKIISLGLSLALLGYILAATIGQPPEHILSYFYAFCILIFSSFTPINNSHNKPAKNSTGHSVFERNQLRFATLLLGRVSLLFLSILWISKLVVLNMQGVYSIKGSLIERKNIPSFTIEDSRKITTPQVSPAMTKWYEDGDNILVVGYNNIYSFHYLTEPVKNNLLYWHDGVTFNRELIKTDPYFHPENIFPNVSLIYLTREHKHHDSVNAFLESYADTLSTNYEIMESSKTWTILRRK